MLYQLGKTSTTQAYFCIGGSSRCYLPRQKQTLVTQSKNKILEPKNIYSGEEIRNISALGDVLRQIRARLIREGVSIDDERERLLMNKANRVTM